MASTVHVLATGGSLGSAHLFLVVAGDARPLLAFFAVGSLVTVTYNLLLLIEELAVRVAA